MVIPPPIPTSLTYDLSSPRRPALADLQLATKTDDQEFPPTDPTMPCSAEWNQQAGQIASLSKTSAVSVFGVHFNAGTPAVTAQQSAPSAEPVFTVVDNGAGNTSITWPANTFPPSVMPAIASLVTDVDATIVCLPITNGVQVKTRVAGTLTDADFVVTVR